MCGIAGEICWNHRLGENRLALEQRREVLWRRGPDQEGEYMDEYAALLHRRLCVMDLQHGGQPMLCSRGGETYAMVYNGELYNAPELRERLGALGCSFQGHSDTEALLMAYVEWGEDCLQYLNGIFAFAVWEKHNRRLFLARDRMGVKPLFYAQAGDSFLFASEIKSLLADPVLCPELDAQGAAELLLLGPGRTPGCGVLRNIHELRPATCGYYNRDGLALRRYWRLEDRDHTDSLKQTVETVRFLVTDAVERQLVSDVPVCTFLSGGLDSSAISAIADQFFTKRGIQLHTFSVAYQNNEKYFHANHFQPGSDDKYILRMNERLNAVHHRVVLDTPELVQALYKAVDARDLPGMADVDASLLLFCREVKKQATVALSGECADEIFGGYPWYQEKELLMRHGFPWSQATAYRAGFLRDEFCAAVDAEQFVESRYQSTLADVSMRRGISEQEARLREMTRLNTDWFMQTLLDRKDRMSMYSALEVRVPFCDHRIAEYLYSIPWEYKNYRNYEKGLLRESMKGLLPEEVLWRKKSPYPKTQNPAYLQAVSNQLREVLSCPSSPLLQLVKKSKLQELLDSDNRQPWYGQLMTVPQTIAYFLQVNYWLKQYRVQLV